MKKITIGVVIVALVAAAFYFVPSAAAQGNPPDAPQHNRLENFCSYSERSGVMHDLILGYFADATGMSVEELESALEEGQEPHELLSDLGYSEEEIKKKIRLFFQITEPTKLI